MLAIAGCGLTATAPHARGGRTHLAAATGAGTTTTPRAAPTTTTPPPTTSTTVPRPTTTTTAPPPTTTTVPVVPKGTTVGPGATGSVVMAVQKRLTQLGYWIGNLDGYYGDSTIQAVYALQKAAGITTDGVVGPQTAGALAKGVVPRPRPAKGNLIEVNLEKDLLMFVHDGKLVYVLNTSTGGGYTYVDKGVTYVATTPTGIYHVYYGIDGLVTDSLGQLWRPRYFYSGFAIHGDGYVPPVPVSHGCVRVSNEAIDWIWANNMAPVGAEVWVF
jgi:peptidoglycan hydrolase-like protein with peptidoglycan-binding domain